MHMTTKCVYRLFYRALLQKRPIILYIHTHLHTYSCKCVYTHAPIYIHLHTECVCRIHTVSYSHTYSHIQYILYAYPPALVYTQLRSHTVYKQLSIAYCVYATNYACARHIFMTTTCSSSRLLKIIGLFCKRAL